MNRDQHRSISLGLEHIVLSGEYDILDDSDLLLMLLSSAGHSSWTYKRASNLLKRYHSISRLIASRPEQLGQRGGISRSEVLSIKLIHALALRMLYRDAKQRPIVNNYKALTDYVRARSNQDVRNHYRVIFLDASLRVLADERQATGTIDRACIYPREIARTLIEHGAWGVIVVFNCSQFVRSGKQSMVSVCEHELRNIESALTSVGGRLFEYLVVSESSIFGLKNLEGCTRLRGQSASTA